MPWPPNSSQRYEQAVGEHLRSLGPGTYVWGTRPAQDSPETWALWPEEAMCRQAHAEALALCSPAVGAVIEERGIELSSVREHIDSRLGTDAERE